MKILVNLEDQVEEIIKEERDNNLLLFNIKN